MLTQERLKELVTYDENTGEFRWKVATAHRIKVGDLAGCYDGEGYRRIKVEGKPYLVHRLAWLYTYGTFPVKDIDHINGIKHDNSLINLRVATRSENQRNTKTRSTNSTGIKGLHKLTAGYYKAAIRVKGIVKTKSFNPKEYVTLDELKQSAREWLESTRQTEHKEFTNHG